MGSARTFVTFHANVPDESQTDQAGVTRVPDGRSICAAIIHSLRRQGLSVSEVSQYKFYGWAFEVIFPKHIAWCLLQSVGPWLLLVEARPRGWRRLVGDDVVQPLVITLTAINAALRGDDRFSSIRWFTKQEYESGGAGGSDSP